MRRSATLFAIVLTAGLVLSAGTALAEEFEYVGAEGCKMCHRAKTGNQWQKWLDGPHASAYETLKNDASAEIVADMGLDGNAWELDQCLECHVTAHGVSEDRLGRRYSVEQGVGCESCHGPGSEYKSMKTMRSHDAAVAAGLVEISTETCTDCHNEDSPTFKGFDYDDYVARIAHPIPAEDE
ncbi:MAG TPA: cytochrome c family protein [Candidatus Krumholzibacteria bacterium]|nr:cytochrome c family protein [Candidatus Krumholzibacteria bacterium]